MTSWEVGPYPPVIIVSLFIIWYSIGNPVLGSVPPLKLGFWAASLFAISALYPLKLENTEDK